MLHEEISLASWSLGSSFLLFYILQQNQILKQKGQFAGYHIDFSCSQLYRSKMKPVHPGSRCSPSLPTDLVWIILQVTSPSHSLIYSCSFLASDCSQISYVREDNTLAAAYENTERKCNFFRTYDLPLGEGKGTTPWFVHSGMTQLKWHVTAENPAHEMPLLLLRGMP